MIQVTFETLTTPESLEQIRQIAAEIWPETFRTILSQAQIAYMMQMMYSPEVMEEELRNGFHFELLHLDGEPAGYLVWSACEEQPQTAKLHKVYLRSKFHRQGYGQQMLNHATEVAGKAHFKTLLLNVNKQNAPAIKAYLRNGFQHLKSVKNPIGNGFFMDDFVMQKALL